MPPDAASLWAFLPLGYALSVALELPVLWFGLSPRHRPRTRLLAAAWLTACTYPIVVLVLPELVWRPHGELAYLLVAESFAPLAECALFTAVAHDRASFGSRGWWRDAAAITAANLCSFVLGSWIT